MDEVDNYRSGDRFRKLREEREREKFSGVANEVTKF
jgi:hypothetical protein